MQFQEVPHGMVKFDTYEGNVTLNIPTDKKDYILTVCIGSKTLSVKHETLVSEENKPLPSTQETRQIDQPMTQEVDQQDVDNDPHSAGGESDVELVVTQKRRSPRILEKNNNKSKIRKIADDADDDDDDDIEEDEEEQKDKKEEIEEYADTQALTQKTPTEYEVCMRDIRIFARDVIRESMDNIVKSQFYSVVIKPAIEWLLSTIGRHGYAEEEINSLIETLKDPSVMVTTSKHDLSKREKCYCCTAPISNLAQKWTVTHSKSATTQILLFGPDCGRKLKTISDLFVFLHSRSKCSSNERHVKYSFETFSTLLSQMEKEVRNISYFGKF